MHTATVYTTVAVVSTGTDLRFSEGPTFKETDRSPGEEYSSPDMEYPGTVATVVPGHCGEDAYWNKICCLSSELASRKQH